MCIFSYNALNVLLGTSGATTDHIVGCRIPQLRYCIWLGIYVKPEITKCNIEGHLH